MLSIKNGNLSYVSVIYTKNETMSLHNPEALTIEREYIYWTNVGQGSEFGAIHKGFTDPFIKNAPLNTYQIYDLDQSFSIAANGDYLFFSGV